MKPDLKLIAHSTTATMWAYESRTEPMASLCKKLAAIADTHLHAGDLVSINGADRCGVHFVRLNPMGPTLLCLEAAV